MPLGEQVTKTTKLTLSLVISRSSFPCQQSFVNRFCHLFTTLFLPTWTKCSNKKTASFTALKQGAPQKGAQLVYWHRSPSEKLWPLSQTDRNPWATGSEKRRHNEKTRFLARVTFSHHSLSLSLLQLVLPLPPHLDPLFSGPPLPPFSTGNISFFSQPSLSHSTSLLSSFTSRPSLSLATTTTNSLNLSAMDSSYFSGCSTSNNSFSFSASFRSLGSPGRLHTCRLLLFLNVYSLQ